MPENLLVKSIPLWRQIQRENFTRLDPLCSYLELSEENRLKLFSLSPFPLNLPKRLAEKIEKNNLEDPIFRQFVPMLEELEKKEGFVQDPVQDKTFRKTNKLLQKYKGRALLITTSACAMNCRFCFRQNFPYETDTYGFQDELQTIRDDPTLEEIILSGGDPLSLSEKTLSELFSSLDQIPHIKRIRFHSRFPIGIPERIDLNFLELLKRSTKKIFFVIHCNHPRELDIAVIAALKNIRELGIPILNQSVLLKGVNDEPATLLALSVALINAQILPYYLHLLDPVEGTGHFFIPEYQALKLIQYVQANLSGFGVPRLVREMPGEVSKSFVTHSC